MLACPSRRITLACPSLRITLACPSRRTMEVCPSRCITGACRSPCTMGGFSQPAAPWRLISTCVSRRDVSICVSRRLVASCDGGRWPPASARLWRDRSPDLLAGRACRSVSVRCLARSSSSSGYLSEDAPVGGGALPVHRAGLRRPTLVRESADLRKSARGALFWWRLRRWGGAGSWRWHLLSSACVRTDGTTNDFFCDDRQARCFD